VPVGSAACADAGAAPAEVVGAQRPAGGEAVPRGVRKALVARPSEPAEEGTLPAAPRAPRAAAARKRVAGPGPGSEDLSDGGGAEGKRRPRPVAAVCDPMQQTGGDATMGTATAEADGSGANPGTSM
jgi:hypothetical protein